MKGKRHIILVVIVLLACQNYLSQNTVLDNYIKEGIDNNLALKQKYNSFNFV